MNNKYLIPAALLASLGANTYFIAGGAEQYARATEILDNEPVEAVYNTTCTAAQRTAFAPIFTNYVLNPINSKYGSSVTLSDLRPLRRQRITIDLYTPLNSSGIPVAGLPTGNQCLWTREVWARTERTLAAPGE